MSSVIVTVESATVLSTLERLDTAISPVGLAAFLTGGVEPYLRERAESRFANEGDDVSGKWAPLAPATQDIRSRGNWNVGPTGPINVRTTELERYVTQSDAAVNPHSLGATLRYPGKRTTRRSITEKMRTAQQGRSSPRTPPRPVLGMNEKDVAAVTELLMLHVNKAIGL